MILVPLMSLSLSACGTVPISESELCLGSIEARDSLISDLSASNDQNIKISGANLVAKIDAGCGV